MIELNIDEYNVDNNDNGIESSTDESMIISQEKNDKQVVELMKKSLKDRIHRYWREEVF
jgi:hypothetical protein